MVQFVISPLFILKTQDRHPANGFKFINSDDHQNGNGKEYVYMAFAENPFVCNLDRETAAEPLSTTVS